MVNNFPVNGKLRPSKYLDYLIDSSFQGVNINRLFLFFHFKMRHNKNVRSRHLLVQRQLQQKVVNNKTTEKS